MNLRRLLPHHPFVRAISRRGRAFPTIAILMAVMSAPALGGGIAGTIRDANTTAPLDGIDLDVFDSTFTPVAGVNGRTDATGVYNLSPLAEGDYYLRADPSTAQGYVDQYYPGVFLKSQATMLHVNAVGSTIVDFNLDRGATISGRITDATTGLPIDLMDLDCYASDRSYISSINAKSAADGTYTIGCFPPGQFYVRANPAVTDNHVIEYYNVKRTLTLADPIVIIGTTNVANINFNLVLGGTVSGVVKSQATNQPIAGVDLDIFDTLGTYIGYSDAVTALDGTYMMNALEPGNYYVQADPTALQGYVDEFYPGVFDMTLATLVHIGAGAPASGVDITLPVGGTISGRVTSAVTGLPIPNLRVSVFGGQGTIISAFGASTAADGTFLVGAMPTGTYYVRSAGDPVQGLAFEFYGGTCRWSLASPIQTTAGFDTPNKDIALDAGWWITGRVRAGDTFLPLASVDLDVFTPYGTEKLGALSASTDFTGAYTIGPIPLGSWDVQADPSKLYPYMVQYYNHASSFMTATQVSAPAGVTVPNINFDVLHLAPTDASGADPAAGRLLLGAAPNPSFGPTAIAFTLPAAADVALTIHDASGRLEAVLADGRFEPGRHEVRWQGTAAGGRDLPGGMHFVRLRAGDRIEQGKLLIIH